MKDDEELDAEELVNRAEETEKKERQVDMLLKVGPASDALFHTPDGEAWADVASADGAVRETWRVKSGHFKSSLRRRFYQQHSIVPAREALQQAVDMIEAMAADADEREVFTRVGSHAGAVYIDLCNKRWQAIKITAKGWSIDPRPPVRFRRSKGMLSLPEPKRGGTITRLRKFINLRPGDDGDRDFVLLIAWLLAALRHHSTYPVLATIGEQGSAKSTLSRILRSLVDPNTAPLRALPRDNWDCFISATNSYVQAPDNVSGIPDWLSDTMCRLSTGGGFSVRQLYSDDAETLFNTSRPQIINGITDIINRPDLADRAVFVTLQAIPEDRRRTEREIFTEFELELPLILGALLTAVACGLRELPSVRLERLPRMADFAIWAHACEPAMAWPAGTFARAYALSRQGAAEAIIDSDAVASAVQQFMSTRMAWTGIAKALLPLLTDIVGEKASAAKDWPKTPRGLRGPLQRAAAPLRHVGITVSFDASRHREGRLIIIEKDSSDPLAPGKPSQPSQPSSFQEQPCKDNDLVEDGVEDGSAGAPGNRPQDRPHPGQPSSRPSSANPLKTNGNGIDEDGEDGEDGVAGDKGSEQACAYCGRAYGQLVTVADADGRTHQLHPHCVDLWERLELPESLRADRRAPA
jgi:hypothetical protein